MTDANTRRPRNKPRLEDELGSPGPDLARDSGGRGDLRGALLATWSLVLANDRLPPTRRDARLPAAHPAAVYAADGQLIGEFGEERRTFVPSSKTSRTVRQGAILAAEDARFFEHVGVDLVGIARAALANLVAGGTEQGASTITMQVAREFFLSSERTYTRKIYEILLALRIEESLCKEQILEIYLNQIFLGKRAYGFAAAPQTYFGKPLATLSAAEAAMLAGLPKAPSLLQPDGQPEARAPSGSTTSCGRMRETGAADRAADYRVGARRSNCATPIRLATIPRHAPYVAELARQLAFDLYREDTYTAGLKVYTTIRSARSACRQRGGRRRRARVRPRATATAARRPA